MLKPASPILILGFISFVLSGCTIISIENAGSVKTDFYPGLVLLQVNNAQNNLTISSRGLGTFLNGEGATFGYFNEQRVYLNDLSECTTVFFEAQSQPVVCKEK